MIEVILNLEDKISSLDIVKGLDIAREAGQVKEIIGGILTSEDLY